MLGIETVLGRPYNLPSILDRLLNFKSQYRMNGSYKPEGKYDTSPNEKILTSLRSNIPTSTAYGIYISQLIRCSDFVKRHQCLSRKLMNQGYVKERLFLFLKKFIGRYQDLVDKYCVSTSYK